MVYKAILRTSVGAVVVRTKSSFTEICTDKHPRIKKTIHVLMLPFWLMILMGQSLSQNLNPPFPRIGQVTFYWAGSGPTIWENHDFLAIRFQRTSDARRIKEVNPDVILLAANDHIASPPKRGFPDKWWIKKANGEKFLLWSDDVFLMDLTEECPVADGGYGPQKFNEYLAQFLVESTDWNYFDGTFMDYWANQIWNPVQVDIDRDGSPDSKSFVNQKWAEGNLKFIENYRKLINNPIVAHEAGAHYLNGNGFEFWSQSNPGSRDWNMNKALELQDKAAKPAIVYANSEADGFGAVFRADFTSAQIAGAFFGHDEGTSAHRWTYLHDEYEAQLGYPTSIPQKLENGVWIRYFDNGVLVSNISGENKSLFASQLADGPYWRFLGQQDPSFNNGQQFTSITFQPFDGVMLFKQPTTLVTPVIIDNVARNMTSLGQNPVEYSGSWTQVKWDDTSKKFAYSLGYGWDQYAYPYAKTNDSGTATYNANLGIEGSYEVFEWHTDSAADGQGMGCSKVRLTIQSTSGETEKIVNQTSDAGQWNSVGIYTFDKGRSSSIRLSAPGGCTTVSDAIRFVFRDPDYIADTDPPKPPTGVDVNK